jgi:hypothetical protein
VGQHHVRPYDPIPTVAHNGNTVLLSAISRGERITGGYQE